MQVEICRAAGKRSEAVLLAIICLQTSGNSHRFGYLCDGLPAGVANSSRGAVQQFLPLQWPVTMERMDY